MKLFDFQKEVLNASESLNKIAYYYDMGLGKTFIGAEKLYRLNTNVNLVICQKSKVADWKQHFIDNYDFKVYDLTKKKEFESFFTDSGRKVGIINYDLVFRRENLRKLDNFTLLLDESSLIQNNSQRSKFILNFLHSENIILLSGTPTGGKYEKLYNQLKLLGLKMTKSEFWDKYVNYHVYDDLGFPLKIVTGYKNITDLKKRMHELGCFFKKTEEVHDLPKQQFINVNVKSSKQYKEFVKTGVCGEFIGDTVLKQMLYERILCSSYNDEKIKAVEDLLSSSDDRFIIFYNFDNEFTKLRALCKKLNRPVSFVNGKMKDLQNYGDAEDSVTLIQYQAGSMGLNLQKCNKIIYFTPCLSSELFEQSKKRIHRIGQEKSCFYYQLICKDSIEEDIYFNLSLRKDYTDKLFTRSAKCKTLSI